MTNGILTPLVIKGKWMYFFKSWGIYGEFQKLKGYMVQKKMSEVYGEKIESFFIHLNIHFDDKLL